MSRLFGPALALAAATLAACALPDETPTTTPVETAQAASAVQTAAAPAQLIAVSGPEDSLIVPVAYRCAGERVFTAAFPADGRSVTVTAAGETRVLPHRGGAGALTFADAGATLVAEGAGATLFGLPGGPYAECAAG